jgi:phosphoribosylaminoimidazolecarboxamide formyltransferase/IMP cyclohydrolase
MIRAAAKNHDDVAVVVDAAGLPGRARRTGRQQRRHHADAAPRLAAKAYARTAAYDAAISNWFAASSRPTRRISAPSAAG